MSIAGTEALAGLQLLVAIAKAGGEPTDEDREVIEEALEQAELPAGITTGALLRSSYDVDEQIAQVASRSAREIAFGACLAIANVRRACRPRQQAILDRIAKAWAVPAIAAGRPARSGWDRTAVPT